MKQWQRGLVELPLLGRCILFVYRAMKALGYHLSLLKNFVVWLFKSREVDNFTYELTELNKQQLASLIAHVTGVEYSQILGYMEELDGDAELRNHIRQATRESADAYMADPEARFGKRACWYAFVRAMKPEVVVETGIDKGLGSCVLTAALMRNDREGQRGRYFGTDINPRAGYLLCGPYAQYGEVLYGDSIESLRALPHKIDLFINDSDHAAEYEEAEYKVVEDKLQTHGVILGDNAHCNNELLEFAHKTGRHFIAFHEKPMAHWYPGGDTGIAFMPRREPAGVVSMPSTRASPPPPAPDS